MKLEKQKHGGALVRPEKGQTANPNGRPKGSLNRSTIAKRWLEVMQDSKTPLAAKLKS